MFEKPGVTKQYKNALVLLLSVVIMLTAAFFIFRQFNDNELKQVEVYEPTKPPALDKVHWHDNIPTDQSGSPAVLWLEKEISLMQGLTKESGFKKNFYGEFLNEVKKFQLDSGLIPDGAAGAKSIVEINNATGSEEPGLNGIREDK
ncbi:MAG: hypothetical protein AB1306_12255 [Nitrospirota bacterium]